MIGDGSVGGRRKKVVATGAPPWMATFADLSILLLAFFVLLLSFSEMDVEKYKQVAGSMRVAFGVQRTEFARDTPKGTSFVMREFTPGKPDPSPIRVIQQQTDDSLRRFLKVEQAGVPINSPAIEEGGTSNSDAVERKARDNLERIRAILGEEIKRGLVEVQQAGTRITIRIRERGSFPSGSARLIEPFAPVIRKIGQAIQLTDSEVMIAGHTDNVPISNTRYRSNWELSASRAATLVHRLEAITDIDPHRLVIKGYADTRPLVANDSVLGRARNRRVEVVLVNGDDVGSSTSVEAFLGKVAGTDEEGSDGD